MHNEGLLWYNGKGQALAELLGVAVPRFITKFGCSPTHCYVNPTDFDGCTAVAPAGDTTTLAVQPRQYVIARHVLLKREAGNG